MDLWRTHHALADSSHSSVDIMFTLQQSYFVVLCGSILADTFASVHLLIEVLLSIECSPAVTIAVSLLCGARK